MDTIPVLPSQDWLPQLAKLAINRELIPIFGSGFTSGCQACVGTVPDTSRATTGMKELLLRYASPVFSNSDLDSVDFSIISGLFFKYVPLEIRAQYFEKNYTGVSLFPNQINFLNTISWPYAYTLNVDDGIEKNSDFMPILPYHKFRYPSTSKRLLYKLHGDALQESKYKDDNQENIIFSQTQYMQAITSEHNTDIYKALLSDYSQRHILFIGCSLKSEQDLQYIYEKSKIFQKETLRVVVRRNVPDIIEQDALKRHGVNKIILVDSYEKFYSDFVETYTALQEERRETIYAYINPTVKNIKDKTESLNLLAGENIFSCDTNSFSKGAFHIVRNAVRDIISIINSNTSVLLKGRRFSGKTYILCSLVDYYKTKDIYYFPSTSFADEDVVDNLLSNNQNSLFLFDSNSITQEVYRLLIKHGPKLSDNNNQLVIAINSSDNFLLDKLKCTVVEIKNSFVHDELVLSEKALDAYGLTRRKPRQTNIDYLYVLKRYQSIRIPFSINNASTFTPAEKRVLIALSALDKLYYSDLISLNFSQREIVDFCNKTTPLIELVPTSQDETTRHSSTKIVHNSKLALVEILRDFSTDDISKSITYIVSRFKPDYSRRRLYIEVILFDTLNQLFAGREKLKLLISTIYADLQPMLENDLHYWLQRAKSIYRTNPSREELDEAYTYAKKAYLDGNQSLYPKAALTTALISCALSEKVEPEEKLGYSEEAVLLAHESVFSEYFRLNPNYLTAELPIGENTHSERRIINACEDVRSNSEQVDIIDKGIEIMNEFETMRKRNLRMTRSNRYK